MTRRRIVLSAFVMGCAVKGALTGLFYVAHPDWVFRWTVTYDPLVTVSGEYLARLCPQPGIAPSTCALLVFDVWGVLGFGLECAGAALLVQVLLAVRRGMADPTRRR
jgi:hypothetical protein